MELALIRTIAWIDLVNSLCRIFGLMDLCIQSMFERGRLTCSLTL